MCTAPPGITKSNENLCKSPTPHIRTCTCAAAYSYAAVCTCPLEGSKKTTRTRCKARFKKSSCRAKPPSAQANINGRKGVMELGESRLGLPCVHHACNGSLTGSLTSRHGGLACPECHWPAWPSGRCCSPSTSGSCLPHPSGSAGSTWAPRPPAAAAHLL